MQNRAKTDKTAQIGAIKYAISVLKARQVIKNQKEFAVLCGITEQSLSAALAGRDRFINDKLVQRIKDFMQNDYGVDIFGPASQIFITGEAIAAPSAPADSSIHIDDNSEKLLKLLAEKDQQINRLLTLLENEQNARKINQ